MGAGVVTVGRRVYAVGLYWENSPTGRVSQVAKEAARQPGQKADFYAIRPGDKGGRVPQFGLGQGGVGHKSGMPAFAGCLANQQLGSWGGAFRLREGTVITIVRDDLIVPDGDQLFLNESEARDRLLQEIGFGGLQRIYAPESWAISGADTMPVSLLLNERHDVRLQIVEIPQKMLIVGGVAATVLLLALGGGWYYQEQQAEEEARRIAQLNELEKVRHEVKQITFQEPIQYPPPERKWEKQPQPMAIIDACRVGLGQIPAAIAGWHLTQLKCSGDSINLGWSHEKSFSRPPEKAVVNDSGTQASLTIPLSKIPARGAENLVNPVEVTHRYLAQDWPGSISRAQDDPPPPPPEGYHGTWAPPPAPWLKRSFTVTVPELPSDLPLYFGDLPGVVIDSLSYSGSSWTIGGVIYENRT